MARGCLRIFQLAVFFTEHSLPQIESIPTMYVHALAKRFIHSISDPPGTTMYPHELSKSPPSSPQQHMQAGPPPIMVFHVIWPA